MDVMRLIKKNSTLLLPIGITLAAVVMFVPALLAGKAVRTQMQESLNLGGQIETLERSTPPATQYQVERGYQQKHADDANAVTRLTRQTSERELLVYGLFPEPNETSSVIFVNFGKTYRKAIQDMVTELRARDCPSEMEIADVMKQGAGGGAGDSVAYGAGGRNDPIVDQFCRDRAESIPVYANPEIFSGYDFWDNYNYTSRDEAMADCWKAQLAYWIQKDIVDTIAVMNANSSSVSKSPVKRLVGISFTSEFTDAARGQRGAEATADAPRYVTSKTEGILATPWTGRTSTGDLDVVHFSFSVIVSNKAVQQFMKELCSQKTHTFKGWSGQESPQQFVHNQITILKSSIEPVVNAAELRADRYRYGDDAAVRVNLVCEYVFNKTGFTLPGKDGAQKSIIPKSVSGMSAGAATSQSRTTSRPSKSKSGGSSKKQGGGGDEGDI